MATVNGRESKVIREKLLAWKTSWRCLSSDSLVVESHIQQALSHVHLSASVMALWCWWEWKEM